MAMDIDPKQQTFELALFAAYSCLVTELARRGSIDFQDLVTGLEATSASHRQKGNDILAQYLHGMAQKLVPPAGPSALGPSQR